MRAKRPRALHRSGPEVWEEEGGVGDCVVLGR